MNWVNDELKQTADEHRAILLKAVGKCNIAALRVGT
jgi:hypothetical protein